jgi:hypothetical protein
LLLALVDHLRLDTVGVGEIGLLRVGVGGTDHVLLALLLVLLLRAFLAYHLQIVDQVLHLLLASLLVSLDVVDHQVDSLLGLFVVMLLSLLHVLLDCLRGLDSQIVLDHVHVLQLLSYLLVRVDERER